MANQKNASFLIKTNYLRDEDLLTLNLNCYRIIDNVLLHSIRNSINIDLELDSAIRKAARELIVFIKQDIKNNPNLVQIITQDEEVLEEEQEDLSSDSTTENIPPAQITEPIVETVKFRHFTVSTGFSPFMTTGDASNYFTFGMGPDLHTAYNFRTPFGYFGLGIYSSLIYFTAEGLLVSSENLLISAGPEIRLGIDANPFLGIFLRINGGGTYFMMNKNDEGYESTVIPFVSGGMGITLNITSGFGIVVSTKYYLVFVFFRLITEKV